MRFPAPWVGVPVTVIAAVLVLRGPVVHGQQHSGSEGGDLAQLYAQGIAAFQAGDYAKAASDLDALLNKAEFRLFQCGRLQQSDHRIQELPDEVP